jgi:hypothetical protein
MGKESDRASEVAAVVNRFAPGFRLQQKSASPLMRVIGAVFRPFAPAFMSAFWTTLPRLIGGSTSYRPTVTDAADFHGEAEVIAHEGLHAQQAGAATPVRRFIAGLRYVAGYLFPTPLLLLGILLIAAGATWTGIATAVLSLCPLPSPWRAGYEEAAYRVSAAADFWRYGMTGDQQAAEIEWMVEQFTGWNYYKMAPFSGAALKARFEQWYAALEADAAETRTPYLVEIKALMLRYRAEDAA